MALDLAGNVAGFPQDSHIPIFAAAHDAGVHLEVCTSVNLQIDFFPDMIAHSVDRLRKAGVSVGINTDARLTAGTTLTKEYRALQAAFGWGRTYFVAVNRQAMEASFARRH